MANNAVFGSGYRPMRGVIDRIGTRACGRRHASGKPVLQRSIALRMLDSADGAVFLSAARKLICIDIHENRPVIQGRLGRRRGEPDECRLEGAVHMDMTSTSNPTLHVFHQEGGWHWGITVERTAGGMKVVAYSDEGFGSEEEAREDGEYVLRSEDWRSRQSFSRSERRHDYS
jgi:hypothetical protein